MVKKKHILFNEFGFIQKLQNEIKSKNSCVSSVIEICERLKNDYKQQIDQIPFDYATDLENRWHQIWIYSLEIQCKIEEKIKISKVKIHLGFFLTVYSRGKRNANCLLINVCHTYFKNDKCVVLLVPITLSFFFILYNCYIFRVPSPSKWHARPFMYDSTIAIISYFNDISFS